MDEHGTGRHLLIVAHGSRRQASNDEVMALGERVRELAGKTFDDVAVAFLELAAPAIPEALSRCVGQGAREILVFPYFLAAGTHVAQDIPDILAAFRAGRPDITVGLAPHLGALPTLAAAVLAGATRQVG